MTGISLAGQQLAGDGMKEIGYYRIEGGESWASKTPKISRNGDFHLYSNDIERGCRRPLHPPTQPQLLFVLGGA